MRLARRGNRKGGPVVSSVDCWSLGRLACRPLDWDPLVHPNCTVAPPVRRIQNPTHAPSHGIHGLLANFILSLALIVQIFSRGSTIDDSTLLVGFTA